MSIERHIISELNEVRRLLLQSRERERRIEEYLIMALQPEVQALLDAVAVQGDAIMGATGHLTELEAHVVDLDAKLAAVQPNVPIDAEDLAAIVAVTGTITNSIANIKSAMPQPVAPAVVVAVEEAPAAPPADAPPPDTPPSP